MGTGVIRKSRDDWFSRKLRGHIQLSDHQIFDRVLILSAREQARDRWRRGACLGWWFDPGTFLSRSLNFRTGVTAQHAGDKKYTYLAQGSRLNGHAAPQVPQPLACCRSA